jgi:outer membrane protein assembly factor BamB
MFLLKCGGINLINNKIIVCILTIFLTSTVFLPLVNAESKLITSGEMIKNNLIHKNRIFNTQFNLDDRNVIIELDQNGIAYGHELLWKADTTGTNYEESAVTYLDGIAYIGSCSTHGDGHDKLFAVDTNNGDILWSFPTGPGYVGPVIDGDVVYIGSDSHGNNPTNEYMFAVNRFTGEEIWNRNIYRGIPESVQYDDKKIYFCSDTVYALNKEDGSTNWTYPLDSLCVTKPMLKDGFFYTASSGGKLYKIDTADGNRIWSVVVSSGQGPWDNSITADNEGHIFLGIYYDKTINAYYETNGSLIWSYRLHDGPLSFNAYHDGVIFISDTQGYVYALDSTDGALIWEKKIGNKIDISSPTISNGLLFIGTRDWEYGALFALDETTGDIIWKYHVGSSITCPPSIADGIMFCGSDGWYMYAFDFGIGGGDWLLHRYDQYNTAYSPDGLTEWQYVHAECETINDVTTCTITNNYDHEVINVNLKLDNNLKADWYDSTGNLLKSDSDNYIIDELSSLSSETFIISNVELHPPEKPSHILGPESGEINKKYNYTTSTTDPDGDDLYYLFDWGDDSDSGWLGPYASGTEVEASNIWTIQDSYEIRVKAKDTYGFETDWSDPLIITMPKNKQIKNQIINQILKIIIIRFQLLARFPSMFY